MPEHPSPPFAPALLLFAALAGGCAGAGAPEPGQDAPERAVTEARTGEPGAVEDAARPQGEADERAAALAARVMERLGGREAWDRTRVVSWRFFGGRRHVWDKHTGDFRIEDGALVLLGNVGEDAVRAFEDGAELDDPERLAELAARARSMWINDSYWMFMPFKLRDPGVRLAWAGRGELPDGRGVELLELTFDGVGETPENRYVVFVADDTGRIEQWSFYRTAEQADPNLVTPWADWRRYGDVWLAGDRGRGADWSIAVYDEPPAGVFEAPTASE